MPALVALQFVALLALWIGITRHVVSKLRAGTPIVPYEPRDHVPWRVVEVVLLGAAYVVLQAYAQPLSAFIAPDAAHLLQLLIASCISNALMTALVLVVLSQVCGARRFDLGLASPFQARYLLWGLAAFVFIVPPTFLVQLLLSRWLTGRHPIVELLQNNPGWQTVGWAFLAAVVVAPFVEELLFRVVLQGALERSVELPNVLDTPTDAGDDRQPVDPAVQWRPILISSTIFALLHFNGGPDPIPLFCLALVLGYLYQRTHSIVPGLVVHAAINSLSLILLLLGVGQEAGV